MQNDPQMDLIEFEITESAFAVDNIHLNQLMEQLQKNHFRVLMDDFGSGYSSLNALRELSVDILKIDIKFLPVSQNDKRADIILRSVTQLADQLGLEMVVEGVETEAQADLLKKMGCRIAQGFLYYRPMPIEEYERVNRGKQEMSMEDLILIVDDARFARRIETKALQDAGFEHIVEAKTAKEALQIFEEQAPELTLLDITLPDNSDLTLLRTMIKIRPEAKIVMNSAIGQELIIQDALNAGARDFITKPFKEKEFIEKIVKVMKGN